MQDTEFYTMILGLKRPWKVVRVVLDQDRERVDVWAEHDREWKWCCPVCGKPAPVYDHCDEQAWRHLDTCQYQTFLHARLVRTNCPEHGIKQVPSSWATSRSKFTMVFECRMIDTLKECDTLGACRLMGTNWDETWSVVERAVKRGQERKERRVPKYLGIDEKAFAKRHRYETLICDLEKGTVEYVVDDRKQESLEEYFKQFTKQELSGIEAIAMDMWDPYIAATQACVPEGMKKVVFDRFHATRFVTGAVDKVRRKENAILLKEGDDSLKGTRYLWLANEEELSDQRQAEFDEIKRLNLKTSRAWALKESLRPFWNYFSVSWARKFFNRWYFWATHSRLEPMIKAAKTLKRHIENILTFFKHRITNATAEGLNSKIQMVKEMACGFRNRDHYKTAIYFHCGGLDLYPCLETGEA